MSSLCSCWHHALIQSFFLNLYIPLSYIIYVRLFKETKGPDFINSYSHSSFFLPIVLATGIGFMTYVAHHRCIIECGITPGLAADFVDVFNLPNQDITGLELYIQRQIHAGGVVLAGFLGASIYCIGLLMRRVMSLDVSPNVYLHISIRFFCTLLLAYIVGLSVGGSMRHTLEESVTISLGYACFAAFIVGIFPQIGIQYLKNVAVKILRVGFDYSGEVSLTKISGVTEWHEGRFQQEGIENVDNFVNADLDWLESVLPYDKSHIMNWLDEGLLLQYTSSAQIKSLNRIGYHHASIIFKSFHDQASIDIIAQSSDLTEHEIKAIGLNLTHATNIDKIMEFRESDR